LSKRAIEIWPYFGRKIFPSLDLSNMTGKTPVGLTMLGRKVRVQSWRDVLEQTLNIIAESKPEKFDLIAQNFSRYLGKDQQKFRETRQLQNGYFIEVNLSAQTVQGLCRQIISTADLPPEEWRVMTRLS
jgi:hypothetical protein